MSSNPLQKYFRQPKIFISLPSQGIYNHKDAIEGDITKIPVYGMTGMDEIILKTADALLSGESTARVIASCCPSIVDPWDISMLDIDILLSAIRIATYGNSLESSSVCSACNTENTYTLNLSEIIEFYTHCEYNNTFKLDDLTITVRPLTYKQSTDFALKNFELQRTVMQIQEVLDEQERTKANRDILEKITLLRLEIFSAGIESVRIGSEIVTDPEYIKEWVSNTDRYVTQALNDHLDKIKENWTPGNKTAVCENCGHKELIKLELDQSNFFVGA